MQMTIKMKPVLVVQYGENQMSAVHPHTATASLIVSSLPMEYHSFRSCSWYRMPPFAEWKPKPDLTVRAELNNATERGFRHTTTAYAGPRNTAAVAYVDDSDIQFGRGLYIRVRKTF